MKIAVDIMGGDYAPGNPLQGARMALQSHPDLELFLVGQRDLIEAEMKRFDFPQSRAHPVHAPQVVSMLDPPTSALRQKKNSSIAVALSLHKKGVVDAVVSAGNTGAQMAASAWKLGRIEGVLRPVIGSFLPTLKSPCLMLDVGANPDCRGTHLFQFGIMGAILMESCFGLKNPRVGLLSIGKEATKGNKISLFAHQLFSESHLNFAGNIEGSDLLSGKVDVAVCDGFVGNLLLKFGEVFPRFMMEKLCASDNGFDCQGLIEFVKKNLNPDNFGGVPILGVKGVSVVCHGASSPLAIANAIQVAVDMAERELGDLIAERISDIRRFYEMNKYFRSLKKRWERRRTEVYRSPRRFFTWFLERESEE